MNAHTHSSRNYAVRFDRYLLLLLAFMLSIGDPRAATVADLLLQPVVSRTMQRRLAEEARLSSIVFRFSSVDNATTPAGAVVPPSSSRGERKYRRHNPATVGSTLATN